MQGFSPSPIYLLLTGAYFIVLEEKVSANMPRLLISASIPIMEGEEVVWSPIILKVLDIIVELEFLSCV